MVREISEYYSSRKGEGEENDMHDRALRLWKEHRALADEEYWDYMGFWQQWCGRRRIHII
jgi:hypothetical protein